MDQYFDVIEDAKAQMYEVTCKSPQPNGVRAKVVYILKEMHWEDNVLNKLTSSGDHCNHVPKRVENGKNLATNKWPKKEVQSAMNVTKRRPRKEMEESTIASWFQLHKCCRRGAGGVQQMRRLGDRGPGSAAGSPHRDGHSRVSGPSTSHRK